MTNGDAQETFTVSQASILKAEDLTAPALRGLLRMAYRAQGYRPPRPLSSMRKAELVTRWAKVLTDEIQTRRM